MAVLSYRFPLNHEFFPLRLSLVANLDFLSLPRGYAAADRDHCSFAMQAKKMLAVFIVSVMVAREPSLAEEKGNSPRRPDFVASRDVSWKSFIEPENLVWPAYFWYWNGPPTPDVLLEQLADMARHDARSVCVVPMPHDFRPVTMNTSMDVDYLSSEFFQRVKVAADEAARRRMNYWIYDEGGWPSGQAAGRVARTRPDVAVRVPRCDAEGKWTPDIVANWPPGEMGVADLLNPQSTRTFMALTHQRYAAAVGSHFGKAIKLTFTDEPKYQAALPGNVVPWPVGAEDVFRRWFGYDAMENLDAFRVTQMKNLSTAQKKVRVDMFDFWSRRFRDAHFLQLRDLMLGERPHFGSVNPLWDFLPEFHRYLARLGYLLSCGKPAIEIGLYYPVRDLWASADPADAALHDALARELLRRQCDFDIVDDDVLSAQPAGVEDGALVAGAMRYRTIVVGRA
ncbi:MAG: hypothetical protein GXY83_25935, partial [Rhodopirellula sp.]|nr:hypothetical protein [Rhodopirellula sp.]